MSDYGPQSPDAHAAQTDQMQAIERTMREHPDWSVADAVAHLKARQELNAATPEGLVLLKVHVEPCIRQLQRFYKTVFLEPHLATEEDWPTLREALARLIAAGDTIEKFVQVGFDEPRPAQGRIMRERPRPEDIRRDRLTLRPDELGPGTPEHR